MKYTMRFLLLAISFSFCGIIQAQFSNSDIARMNETARLYDQARQEKATRAADYKAKLALKKAEVALEKLEKYEKKERDELEMQKRQREYKKQQQLAAEQAHYRKMHERAAAAQRAKVYARQEQARADYKSKPHVPTLSVVQRAKPDGSVKVVCNGESREFKKQTDADAYIAQMRKQFNEKQGGVSTSRSY